MVTEMLISTESEKLLRKGNSLFLLLLALVFSFILIFKNEVEEFIQCRIFDSCSDTYTEDDTYEESIDDNFLESTMKGINSQNANTKILIYSIARSGSSFLGEIFNRNDDVFYMYEPLHTETVFARAKMFPSAEYKRRATDSVRNIIHCDFNRYQNQFNFISYPELSNPHFRLMSKVLSSPPFCSHHVLPNCTEDNYRKHCYKIQSEVAGKYCRRKKHVVVKELVHRFPLRSMSGILPLFKNYFFRAICLVRDPRAIIWSMAKIGWISYNENAFATTLKAASEKVCQLFVNNFISLNMHQEFIENKLIAVRYEDLVGQPEAVTRRLFHFAKIGIDNDTIDWVVKNTGGQLDNVNIDESFSVLLRNASHSLNSWRKFLPFHIVSIIQESCGEVMGKYGYVLYSSEKDMKNLKKPAFNNHFHVTNIVNIT